MQNDDSQEMLTKRDAFTPGRWMVGAEEVAFAITGIYISKPYKGGEGGRIAQCYGNCQVKTDEQVRANARLIAAAPDMHKALTEMLRLHELARDEGLIRFSKGSSLDKGAKMARAALKRVSL